jgi:hypothetical protein
VEIERPRGLGGEGASARKLVIVLVAMAVAALPGPASLTAATVLDVVNQVSQQQYTQYLSGTNFLYTHNGDSRGFTVQHDLARDNILSTLGGFGLSASLDPFTYKGSTYYNVVAVKPGAINPGNIFIVGAHYDSADTPGADDDASGVSGVLEAARILSKYHFDSTVIFIAFDREEQGMYGSAAYSYAHRNDNILGMISMDMIAFNSSGSLRDTAEIYGKKASDSIKNALAWSVTTYSGGLSPRVGNNLPQSDQWSFETQGKPACLLIEPWEDNTNYHTAADSVDTPNYVDYAFATKMVRSTVGYLAGSAGLLLDGDANRDGIVDLADYAAWFNNFNSTAGVGWTGGDFNGDGVVDLDDYATWFNNFNQGSSQAVPEPAMLAILLLGLPLLRKRR